MALAENIRGDVPSDGRPAINYREGGPLAEFHLISRIERHSDSDYVVSVAILPASPRGKARAQVVKRNVTSRTQAIDARAALLVEAGSTVRMRGDVVTEVVDR